MQTVPHFCQRCLSANALGQEFCAQCGTRLMLITEPPASRFEAEESGPAHGEHLLERISALENRLSRLTDKLQQTLDLMLKQAQNSYLDHTLIESLIVTLSEAGAIEPDTLRRLWREQCRKDDPQTDDERLRDEHR